MNGALRKYHQMETLPTEFAEFSERMPLDTTSIKGFPL
jgi:hypothetical protein